MRWDNLQILLAIYREGSLTRAAKFLGLDQSTAGRRLSALEAELGVVLFIRSKTGFAPTQAGDAAIVRALEVEASINGLVDDVTSSSHSAVGTVRLMGNAWTLERLSCQAVGAFLKKNPQLNLRTISLLRNSHVRGEASVSIWFEKKPESGEFSVRLGEVPYALYQSVSVDPGPNWVSFYDEDERRPMISSAISRLRQKGDTMRFTATDASILHCAVAAGVGRGLLPMCLAEADTRLKRINSGPPELMRTLWIHTHPDTVETKRIKVMLKWLRESFDQVFLP